MAITTDAHGDFSFNDHTDGGHSDHADAVFHTDHADTAPHADHDDLSGPGHLDSPDQHPPHSDHWDVHHRDHDDKSYNPPAPRPPGCALRRIIWTPAIAITQIPAYQDHTDTFPTRMGPLTTITPTQCTPTRTVTAAHMSTRMPTSTQTRLARSRIPTSTCTRTTVHLDTSHADFHGDTGPRGTARHVDTHGDSGAEGSRRMDDIVPDDDADGAGDLMIHAAIVPRQRRVEAFASDGESLLYSAMRDEASALNRTATEIWELCDGTRTIGAIARALGQRYGVDEAYLLADVTAAVTDASSARARRRVTLTLATTPHERTELPGCELQRSAHRSRVPHGMAGGGAATAPDAPRGGAMAPLRQ